MSNNQYEEPISRPLETVIITTAIGMLSIAALTPNSMYRAHANTAPKPKVEATEKDDSWAVSAPEQIASSANPYMNCHMSYGFGDLSGTFLLDCYPTMQGEDGWDSHVLPDCDFPNADTNYNCEQCSPTEIVRYAGEGSLGRARTDFDGCGIEGLVLSGGWWEAFVYSGVFPVMDAVSPFTLDRLTIDEFHDIDDYFGNQTVGGVTEVRDKRTDRRHPNYFEGKPSPIFIVP